MIWFCCCLLFTSLFAALTIVPVARHATLPRRKKWVISLVIFAVLVPGGMGLYGWVGVPAMAML